MPSLPEHGLGVERGDPPAPDRFPDAPGITLAARTARGSVVNSAFLAAINALGFAKGLVAAGLLGASVYGLWGLIGATASVVFTLGVVGIDDKYIQQDDPDQEKAFQVAFSLQCSVGAVATVAMLAAMPIFALAFGRPEMIVPGMALSAMVPALALQSPLWVFWRRMDFVRQRSLQIWDPVVSLIAVTALALAGLGIWALILGSIAGSAAGAFAAVRASPYALRFRYEHGALREYASFSWPLFMAAGSAVLIGLVPVLVASRSAGVAAVGAITLANTIAQFANRVDEIVTQVLYPAICAVKDRRDLLFQAFSKSNRLALIWALPTGAAAALFAQDFVEYVLGEQWRFAITLIQVMAVTAAVNQIGFNWTAFYRALDDTKPVATSGLVLLAGVLLLAVPLLILEGLSGYAVGMAGATLVSLVVRGFYLARIFPALRVFRHVARAALPTAPAVLVVLAIRSYAGGARSAGDAATELTLFLLTAIVATLAIERDLLLEVLGYFRDASGPRATNA